MIKASRERGRVLLTGAGVAVFLLSACAKSTPTAGPSSPASSPPAASPSASPSSSPSASPSPTGVALQLGTRAIMGIGTVLTNGKGFTLYHLTTDSSSMTTCTGGCAQTWPPLLTTSGKTPSLSGVSGKFGTLTRPDGTVQGGMNGSCGCGTW